VRIDISGFGRGGRELPHEDFLQLCEIADRLGFDGIWFNEFHFQAEPQAYPSTLLLASAVLARTTRLRTGTSILVTPLYHPLLLAEMIAQLHWQSGGRFDLGIGRGTHPLTFDILGIDRDSLRPRFELAQAVLEQAFYAQARMPSGSPWPASDTPVGPLVQHGKVPVYLAGASDETLTFAARNGLPLLLSLEPPERMQLERYAAILAREGLPDMRPASSLSRFVFVAPSRSQADAIFRTRLYALYQRRVEAARRAGMDLATIKPPDPAEFRSAQAIVGTPAECAEQIAGLEAASGISSLRLVFNGNGAFDHVSAFDELQLFGCEALPLLRRCET
jgi:alkanesulfonate monooxygenase SsuD/methylene tetrahydromethanopterin reductase-like flavin-dependent oxidoreductase (luciferase family)